MCERERDRQREGEGAENGQALFLNVYEWQSSCRRKVESLYMPVHKITLKP